MKVKIDFISNSSSTSFVYIAPEMLSKEEFMTAAGVSADSPVASLFEDMFYQLRKSIEQGETLKNVGDLDIFEMRGTLTSEVSVRVRASLEQGQTVTIGSFSSEENLAECTLCTEIFEIESERFFINAYENYW